MKKQLFLVLVTALLAVTSAFGQTPELRIYREAVLFCHALSAVLTANSFPALQKESK